MKLSSPDLDDQGALPEQAVSVALGGRDTPPFLRFEDVPAEAKSLALTCYDPDAPTGSGFWHWILVNIAIPSQRSGEIAPGALPAGAIVVANDAGVVGFSGARPPAGDPRHRYIFTLHALSCERVDVANATQAYVRFRIMTQEIARASLTGYFQNTQA